MSSIRLHHMSLTHPQTLINKSLPKAFRHTKTNQNILEEILEDTTTSWNTPCHKQHQRRFRSTEALIMESSPKASRNFKNFNLEYKEYSKQNHSNHLPRSQNSLESSLKASRNFKKPQISEVLQIEASKAPINFHHKPLKTKNT